MLRIHTTIPFFAVGLMHASLWKIIHQMKNTYINNKCGNNHKIKRSALLLRSLQKKRAEQTANYIPRSWLQLCMRPSPGPNPPPPPAPPKFEGSQ